jgi:nitrite reductase/ring-hydroxylating ferredoxin subunit/uncharacterized membrane protein
MIKYFLQGRYFGHPLHPALVHFPIGLFLLSFLFDAATIFGEGGNNLVLGSFYLLLGGVAMALAAALPGLADWWDIRNDHPSRGTATMHMLLNLTAVALYAVSLLLRYGELNAGTTGTIPFLLAAAGLGLVFFSGYLGGKLVYGDGIGSGRHRRRTELPGETIETAPSVSAGDYVPVAAEESLADGETLRAEVAGHVITIARVAGDFYAFQEFCSHRFGPLSEGHLNDHEVECPWHRSCFDVRTGRVTRGPAKVNLRTYQVRVEDGMIQVRASEEEAEEVEQEQKVEAL